MHDVSSTLSVKRIAYCPPGQQWQWFGPAVHFKAERYFEQPVPFYTAHCVLESQCQELVDRYGLDFCMKEDRVRIVDAPNEKALELVDLTTF